MLDAVRSLCPDAKRLPKLNPVDLANGMNEVMEFSGHEWRWLADRYKLTLNDRNWERRRYGRYGKPGETRKTPPPAEKTPGIDMLALTA